MQEFNTIAIPLGVALGLSLTVERLLEFLKRVLASTVTLEDVKHLSDIPKIHKKYLELAKLQHRDNRQRQSDQGAAEVMGQLVDNKSIDEAKKKALLDGIREYLRDGEIDERMNTTSVAMAGATLPRKERVQREILLQLFGFATGIILAHMVDLRLFSSLALTIGSREHPIAFADWQDYILTGLLVGGGSVPIHTLIQFISKRKVSAQPEAVERAEAVEESPAVVSRPEKAVRTTTPNEQDTPLARLKAIQYFGGVDKEKLEWVHIRKQKPSMIIYHHTAMKRSSSFEEVVNVIKSRTDSKGNHWLTGYNCVITEDGGIHPFCRWDRYGNHAAGLNAKSLGLSFNGNFETNPDIPSANPDGLYGPPQPTEEQVDAGARTVALWCHLYGIPLDFDKHIIPHRQVSEKACPGGNFPYADFQKQVKSYYQQWEQDKEAMDYIEAFRNKKYVKV